VWAGLIICMMWVLLGTMCTVLETPDVRKIISNFFTFDREYSTKCMAALMRELTA
jgi:hypothetical protein